MNMSLNWSQTFSNGLSYREFLEQHGSATDQQKWESVEQSIEITSEQSSLLASFKREMRVICMAGAWCGDCVRQCPIFFHFAQVTSKIQLRFIDRDTIPELAEQLQLCGAARVPQLVFLNEDDQWVGRYGDRTLTAYRQMANELTGAACATGIVTESDSTQTDVIREWLNEFERIQLLLRTSPRLRGRHQD